MKQSQQFKGHLAACLTVFIWGTTFISTKILLKAFLPIEILFIRFLLGFIFLWLIYPKPLPKTNVKQNIFFALAGLTGVTFYFYFENIALTYSSASNIGVIVTLSPFFTALLLWLTANEKLSKRFMIGFLCSLFGVILISFSGQKAFHLNPLGDFLAVLAAFMWSLYSVFTKRISQYSFHVVQSTRRIFFYGLLFMLPFVLLSDLQLNSAIIFQPVNLFNLIFLGLGASAICFVTWSFSIKAIGTLSTSMYIYLVPVITVITSMLILGESLTGLSFIGICLSLFGLIFSDGALFRKKNLLPSESE